MKDVIRCLSLAIWGPIFSQRENGAAIICPNLQVTEIYFRQTLSLSTLFQSELIHDRTPEVRIPVKVCVSAGESIVDIDGTVAVHPGFVEVPDQGLR